MEKNDECFVVKDLSSLYMEKMLSKESENFVDGHLNRCNDCKKYYKDLDFMLLNDKKEEKKNDEIEINHLKQINKKMTKLKWFLTIIIGIILLIIFSMYIKIAYIDSINDLNISKILDMQKESNNYKLTHKTVQINKVTNQTDIIEVVHYYKDGAHKEVINYYRDGVKVDETIKFIEDNAYERTTIFNSLRQIDHQKQDFIEERKGNALNLIISRVMDLDAGIHRLGLTTRTEVFEGKECYVVSDRHSGSYRENYINKENGKLERVVSGSENFYTEETFSLIENIVTDEDVDISILKDEKYKDYTVNNIEYEMDEVMRELYEKDILFK